MPDYGRPLRSGVFLMPGRAGEALDALVEAVEVIRLMWSNERSVRFDGHHSRLAGVKPGAPPVHSLGTWLCVGERRTLALVGRTADGWVPSSGWATPDEPPDMQARIDEAARSRPLTTPP